MRVSKIRDGFGHITRDGIQVHTSVRFMVDVEGSRLAVFGNPKAAPSVIYPLDEVEYTSLRKPCSCKGDAPKMSLWRLWDQSERQTAHAS